MLPQSINTQKQSYELFFQLQTNNPTSQIPPKEADNQVFDNTFPGMFINKPIYKNCQFKGSVFERPAGESSIFNSCKFFDCIFHNADFKYCDIENCTIISEQNRGIIQNSNFSFGTFANTEFIDISIEGTPFKEMIIDSCRFKDCLFDSFGFERTVFKNCSFENIDMSRIVFRFCNFEDISFKNVTIHILDLAKNFGLVNELTCNGKEVKIYYGQDNIIDLETALSILPNLLSYYLNEHEYYYVINILALQNNFKDLWNVLPRAFEYVVSKKDYSSLQDICNLIAKLKIFGSQQLKELYEIIKNYSAPNDLSNHQIRKYSYYLENIKRILLENPNEYPTASITMNTDITPSNMEELLPLLECIEDNINSFDSSINPKIQISRHSPYEIVVYISAALPTLLCVCQIFYYAFGGIKSLKDILSSRHEKTINREYKDKTSNNEKKTNKKKKKDIIISYGSFKFEYHKDTEQHVKDVEYLIS